MEADANERGADGDARKRALCAAAAAKNRLSVLARHAAGARLRAMAPECGIADLLPEGCVLENGAAVPGPEFVRRRAQEERALAAEAVARLPAMWLALIGASGDEAGRMFVRLGVDVAASIARPMPPDAAAMFLTPLGRDLARIGAEQRARRDVPRPPPALLSAWRSLFETTAERGPRLAHACASRVLGDLFRRLPQEDQTLASRVARSAIFTALQVAAPFATGTDDEARLAAGIVGWMLADARRAP